MKKILAMLLSVLLVLAFAAGCSSDNAASGSSDASEAQSSDAPSSSEAESSDGESSSTEGLFPPVAKEDIKVGVIHISDPAEGSGYTYTHDQGIVGMQKALGLSDEQIIRKNK